jgi:hypothetical protein
VRLIVEELAIAGRDLRILVDGDDDRSNVLVAPAFTRGEMSSLFEGA